MTSSSGIGRLKPAPLGRITSGNVQLDAILSGGFPSNTINMLMGEPGSGKTILAEALIFANASPDGRPILYLTTLSEPLEKVVRSLFRIIKEHNIQRVVVDAIGDLIVAASDLNRLCSYLYALVQHFIARRVVCMMTLETTSSGVVPMEGQISALTDAILRLGVEHDGDKARRTLQIVKARGTNHDLNVQELRITSAGVEVG